LFAGRHLDYLLPGGGLWRCLSCDLVFRNPRLPKHELDELYRLGHNEGWPDTFESRTDWLLTAKLVLSLPGVKRVLDVGCFDGRLLDHLESRYEKLGVEMHKGAAAKACKKGIRIIAEDFTELGSHPAVADVVLAIDVIEHTYNPMLFLTELVYATAPGGYIIISTGNTDSTTWKFMGSRYWYCHIAEHLSFINPAWALWAANQLGLEIVSVQSFSHQGSMGGWGIRLREVMVNLAYRAFPGLFAKLRDMGAGGVQVDRFPELRALPPYWLTAKDHIIIAFKKKEELLL
jgi:SAM-dependent methyltransferase